MSTFNQTLTKVGADHFAVGVEQLVILINCVAGLRPDFTLFFTNWSNDLDFCNLDYSHRHLMTTSHTQSIVICPFELLRSVVFATGRRLSLSFGLCSEHDSNDDEQKSG